MGPRWLGSAALAMGMMLAGCSLLVETSDLSTADAAREETEAGPGDAGVEDVPAVDGAVGPEVGSDAAIPVLARDTFSRTTMTGFGEAEVGGRWTVGGDLANYVVSGGAGTSTIRAPGIGVSAFLEGISSDDVDLEAVLFADKLGSGSGLYMTLFGRAFGQDGYGVKLQLGSDGNVRAELLRTQAADEVILVAIPSAFILVPGEAVKTRLQVTGKAPTRLRLKLWKAKDAEPTAWSAETSDSAVPFQTKGAVGLRVYLSSAATNAPVRVSLDDLLVRPASLLP